MSKFNTLKDGDISSVDETSGDVILLFIAFRERAIKIFVILLISWLFVLISIMKKSKVINEYIFIF